MRSWEAAQRVAERQQHQFAQSLESQLREMRHEAGQLESEEINALRAQMKQSRWRVSR